MQILNMWEFFLWLLEQEPANKTYAWMIGILLGVVLIGGLISFIRLVMAIRASAPIGKPSTVTFLSFVCALICCFPIQKLFESYNSVVQKTYEEAEVLFDENSWQAAKSLYSIIYVTNWKDCQEKLLLCDYKSADNCIKSGDYRNAFKLLFPYLSDTSSYSDFEIIDDMQHLAATTVKGVSAANRNSEIFVHPEAMLGKWADQAGNYIRFYSDKDGIHAQGNVIIIPPNMEFYFNMNYGIYEVRIKDTEIWVPECIFCPISKTESYVYNIWSRNLYLLTLSATTAE